MDRVVVVVTRWFGGIKLGAGGLVRAYGGTAAECLRRAERVALVDMCELALHAPFEDLGTVHAALAAASAEKLSETFRSEEHTSELQSLMRISYAVFCLKKKKQYNIRNYKMT